MRIFDLKVGKRTAKKTRAVNRLRKNGQIPAILYGHKQDNIMLCLDEKDLLQMLQAGAKMVRLRFNNEVESALVKDVQYDNIKNQVLHVDFARVDLEEKVRVRVPVELYGECIGVKEGGILTHVLKYVEVECLPTAIPEKVKVNILDLGVGRAIHVKDLPEQEGIKFLSDREAVVVSVHKAVEEKLVSEGTISEPEVITRKPKEGEAGATAAEKV